MLTTTIKLLTNTMKGETYIVQYNRVSTLTNIITVTEQTNIIINTPILIKSVRSMLTTTKTLLTNTIKTNYQHQ